VETDVEVIEDRTGDPFLRKPRTSQLSYACKCWFLRRGENRSTREKTSRSRVENLQTQPTYGVESGNRSWATLVEGECSHHCVTSAPCFSLVEKWRCTRPAYSIGRFSAPTVVKANQNRAISASLKICYFSRKGISGDRGSPWWASDMRVGDHHCFHLQLYPSPMYFFIFCWRWTYAFITWVESMNRLHFWKKFRMSYSISSHSMSSHPIPFHLIPFHPIPFHLILSISYSSIEAILLLSSIEGHLGVSLKLWTIVWCLSAQTVINFQIWPKATLGAGSFWNYQPDIKPDCQEFLTTLSTLQKVSLFITQITRFATVWVVIMGAMFAQCLEHWPTTSVARARFLDSTSYELFVASVICSERFFPCNPVFPFETNVWYSLKAHFYPECIARPHDFVYHEITKIRKIPESLSQSSSKALSR